MATHRMKLDDNDKARISLAYDMFDKEEFLSRVYKFIDESNKLSEQHAIMRIQMAQRVQDIVDAVKSKLPPK